MDYDVVKQLIDNNKYDEAIQELNLLIETNSSDDELFYLKGKIHQCQSQWKNAINAFQKAIDLNGDSKAVASMEMLDNIIKSLNNKIVET